MGVKNLGCHIHRLVCNPTEGLGSYMSTTTQTDLFGNPVKKDAVPDRTYMYGFGDTRRICRDISYTTPHDMEEILAAGVKMVHAAIKVKIPQEDLQKIIETKDVNELINILSKTFSQYLK